MTKLAKRQEILNFKCVCDFCKEDKESDNDIFEDFEKMNQEREKIAIEGIYARVGQLASLLFKKYEFRL